MHEAPLFTAPARVRRLQIEITTGCNLACAGCQRTLGVAAGTWRSRNMRAGVFAAIAANAPPADAIVLQGIGEPTLHNGLPELIRIARATGKFGAVSFNTNALLRDAAYYARLREAGLGHVSISVDSLVPETAEALRAGTDTARLRAMVRELAALFDGAVTLSVVLSRRNLPELESLLLDLRSLGARTVEVQPLVSYAAAIDPLALDARDRAQALAAIARAKRAAPDLAVLPAAALTPDGSRCRRPFRAVYVTVDGFLTPCCLTNDPDLFGRVSLAETPFAEAWARPGVRRFLSAYFDRSPVICQGCAFDPSGDPSGAGADRAARAAEGAAALRAGDAARAEPLFRAALDAPAIDAVRGLGLSLLARGDAAGAAAALRTAQDLAPDARSAHNLGVALERTGDRAGAIAVQRANLAAHPEYVPSYHGLSGALAADGRAGEAAGVALLLAERAAAGGNETVAAEAAARAAALDPAHPDTLRVANRARVAGQSGPALILLDARIGRDPGDLAARLARAMARLAVVHDTEAEIDARRAAYAADLGELDALAAGADRAALARLARAVGDAKPFYLAYQGHDDRALQTAYGRLAARAMAAAEDAPPPRPRRPGGRVRVGFASAYWHLHSVSKLFGGWVRHLDPARFEVFLYRLSAAEDATSTAISAAAAHVRAGDASDAAWARQIRDDALDVLIYPEIGMHPLAVRLAARRLAPVQCAAWGHPVTTGLPTIDWFLSSDLMEPPGAEAHYAERLQRLPGLSVRCDPQPPGSDHPTRAALGFAPADIVYVCCQSAFKYHPGDDRDLAAIAAREARAQFLFVGDPARDPNARRLRARLARSIPESRLVFVPPVPADAFPALLRAGDAYLDSHRWSGGNTTLEAMAVGLPIVTLPGALMRGRHTAAILRQAGAGAWIAASEREYVDLAAALADPGERARARAAVAAGRARVFDDPAPVPALEAFLARAARGGAIAEAA